MGVLKDVRWGSQGTLLLGMVLLRLLVVASTGSAQHSTASVHRLGLDDLVVFLSRIRGAGRSHGSRRASERGSAR